MVALITVIRPSLGLGFASRGCGNHGTRPRPGWTAPKHFGPTYYLIIYPFWRGRLKDIVYSFIFTKLIFIWFKNTSFLWIGLLLTGPNQKCSNNHKRFYIPTFQQNDNTFIALLLYNIKFSWFHNLIQWNSEPDILPKADVPLYIMLHSKKYVIQLCIGKLSR